MVATEAPEKNATMVGQFEVFADAVRARFDEIAKDQLYVVGSDSDEIWATYLAAFPPGTNPMFRQRTEHDCSCCRHFIRAIGNVVGIQNGALVSVWDLNGLPAQYQAVADAMSAYVKALPISDVFVTPLNIAGQPLSHERRGDGPVIAWRHFAAAPPARFVSRDGDQIRGDARTTHAMMKRAVEELRPEAVEDVLGMIAENAIYRGEEFRRAVAEFSQLQARALAVTDPAARDVLLWSLLGSPAARFRNSVIGTLVQDLSDGKDLEAAVRAYEAKVAPANYKRPKALITKGMVDAAMKEVEDLGLEAALERRHARFEDVSVTSVLFVDNAVRGRLRGGLRDALMEEVRPAAFDPTKAEEISADDFLAYILPGCTGLRAYIDGSLLGNFMSLTAPVHEDSGSLFRWDNDFAWSYDGNVADSIKDRVKRAGGQVENVALRISLAWRNTDDLDLHVVGPHGHIYFGHKSDGFGTLDVDMNVGMKLVRDPVENIRWVRTPPDGVYRAVVHSYTKRESIDVGFTVEIESAGGLRTFSHDRALAHHTETKVASFRVERGAIVDLEIGTNINVGERSTEKWGVKTLDTVGVSSVIVSPNHWGERPTGNRHLFFILDGCRNPEPVRGIYNEFLHPRFEKHRKVFEILGDKTKCPVAEEQMSGLGFSSTRHDKVTVIATGPRLNKPYTIVF